MPNKSKYEVTLKNGKFYIDSNPHDPRDNEVAIIPVEDIPIVLELIRKALKQKMLLLKDAIKHMEELPWFQNTTS